LLYQKLLILRNDCSYNLSLSDHVLFFAGKYGVHRLQKIERVNVFIRDDIRKLM